MRVFDFLIIPVHNKVHWTFIMIKKLKQKTIIRYHDSLLTRETASNLKKLKTCMVLFLVVYANSLGKSAKKLFGEIKWEVAKEDEYP